MSAASISDLPRYLFKTLDEVEMIAILGTRYDYDSRGIAMILYSRGCPWKDAVRYIRKAKSMYKPHLRHLVIRDCRQTPEAHERRLANPDSGIFCGI